MLKLSFLNLFRRKTRTILALLGIIVGVTAIIGLVSVVDGLSNMFEEALAVIQGLMIMEVNAFDESQSKVDTDFLAKLDQLQGARVVVPEIWVMASTVNGKPQFGGDDFDIYSMVYMYGTDISRYNQMRGDGWLGGIKKGSKLSPGDRGWILVGENVAEKHNLFVGSSFKINGKRFHVKGILKPVMDEWGGITIMHMDDVRDITNFPTDKYSTYHIELNDPSMDKKMGDLVNLKYGTKLNAMSSASMSETYMPIFDNVRLMVFFIAGLSAIVAGIGIANTVFMSVLERTREIGALKAVGWTNDNIRKMIIYESVFLGVIGGIAGCILGIIISDALGKAIGFDTYVGPMLLLEAFGFALFVGLIAGFYPAARAAKLDPVEAIRSG